MIHSTTDIHCHIIPGMDDGPAAMEQSLAMAEMAAQDGIAAIVATPHYIAVKDIEGFLRDRDSKLEQLQQKLVQKGLCLNIVKGAELYMDMDLLQVNGLDRLAINGTRYMLIELPMTGVPLYTQEFLYRLQLQGFIPIIAHPERNSEIIRKPELLYRLVELGSLAQINTGSITGLFGSAVQACARTILTSGRGHLVATDAHSDGKRSPVMRSCIKTLTNWVGKDSAYRLVKLAPANILEGNVLETNAGAPPINFMVNPGSRNA